MRRLPVVLLLLVAACGTSPAPTTADDFHARAREIAERWQAAPEREAWTDGFVPLAKLTIDPPSRGMPKWTGVSELNAVWELATELPAARPEPGVLTWPDGSELSLPLVTAETAYRAMSRPRDFADEECPAKGCRPLRVTAASLGWAPFPTSRGEARVPVWEFTVAGLPQPFRRVAVDPAAMGGPPQQRKGEWQEVFTYRADGTSLRLTFGYGSCDTTHGGRAYETPQVVVVDADVRPKPDVRVCNAMLHHAETDVRLREPLGTRVVLDAASGLPLLPEAEMHLATGFKHWDPRGS
ncbi:hypothetical protein [Nonomuraea sp. NPDC050310]|uniref:hypothetical protein n=1 Tax=Nonomuraea sp. NPDC050310 TaxID=3154935 RepID=UPI0033D7D586